MRVLVRLYGVLPRYLPEPRAELELDLPTGTAAGQIGERLGLPPGHVAMTAVNGRRVEAGYVLQDGDHVTLFPPVAGG